MKINLFLSPVFADELYFTGKNSVVIDVLRATSTIVTALKNGAKEVIPVATVEFAVKVSGGLFGGLTLLGGERYTKKIEGFALGNSPLEYNPETVSGKSIVLFSTNGTKAIVRAKFSKNLFICSFLNIQAVANKLAEMNEDFEIVCSGTNNNFSMEDTICAGRLITEIIKDKTDVQLNDSAKAAVTLSKTNGKNLNKMLSETEHGKLLIENGFEDDIRYCSKMNVFEGIPAFQSNIIKLLY